MIFTRRRRLPTPVRSPVASSAIPARWDTSSLRMEQRSSEIRRLKSLVLIMDYPCIWLRLSRRREAFACGDARNSGVRQVSRMRQACWHRNVITLAGCPWEADDSGSELRAPTPNGFLPPCSCPGLFAPMLLLPCCHGIRGASPLLRGREQLQPDSKGTVWQALTVPYLRLRPEVTLKRFKQRAVSYPPALVGHDADTMQTDVFGERCFRRVRQVRAGKLYGHCPCTPFFHSTGRQTHLALA